MAMRGAAVDTSHAESLWHMSLRVLIDLDRGYLSQAMINPNPATLQDIEIFFFQVLALPCILVENFFRLCPMSQCMAHSSLLPDILRMTVLRQKAN
jgi:hypothetical protein